MRATLIMKNFLGIVSTSLDNEDGAKLEESLLRWRTSLPRLQQVAPTADIHGSPAKTNSTPYPSCYVRTTLCMYSFTFLFLSNS